MMKKVFITGANGDIGNAIKSHFIKEGYYVTAPSSKELNLENLKDISKYFEEVGRDFSVIVHCAGFNDPKLITDLTMSDLEKTSKINYLSFIEIVKNISPFMKEQKYGKILAISSLYGTIARSGRLAYVTSKHALNGAVKTFTCELGEYNILVNSLSPGFVDTKMTRKNNSEEKIEQLRKKIPLKRLATIDDIAKTAFYLCSSENSYITGQDIIVDGGFMAEGGQN